MLNKTITIKPHDELLSPNLYIYAKIQDASNQKIYMEIMRNRKASKTSIRSTVRNNLAWIQM